MVKPIFNSPTELARGLSNNTLKALLLLAAVEQVLELDLIEPGEMADLLRKRAADFRAEIAD